MADKTQSTGQQSEERKIPVHVAVIMDGNGRWAKKRGMPRTYGHAQGAKTLEKVLKDADDLGIRYFTVYAFSTENWSRPESEVHTLMNLFSTYMVSSIQNCMKNNVRVRIIGDRAPLSDDLRRKIANLEGKTAGNTGIQFQIAINYGGRDEITRAVQKLAAKAAAGEIRPEEITAEEISASLDTADIPDPDLIIRTCGEERLSNFLIWQGAYSEFYFTDKAWPDFDKAELEKAIDAYNHRERRYGGLRQ